METTAVDDARFLKHDLIIEGIPDATNVQFLNIVDVPGSEWLSYSVCKVYLFSTTWWPTSTLLKTFPPRSVQEIREEIANNPSVCGSKWNVSNEYIRCLYAAFPSLYFFTEFCAL